MNVARNNTGEIFLLELCRKKKYLGKMSGRHSIITFALREEGPSIKMRTYANRDRDEGMSMRTFTHLF